MDLKTYLRDNRIRGYAFAAQVGASAASISRLSRGEQMPSADLARRIFDATAGQVTPNDFHDFMAQANGDPSEAAA